MKSAKHMAAMAVLALHIVATGLLSPRFWSTPSIGLVGVWCSLGFALLLWLLQIRGRFLSWATLLLAVTPGALFLVQLLCSDNILGTVLLPWFQLPLFFMVAGLDVWELTRLARRNRIRPDAERQKDAERMIRGKRILTTVFLAFDLLVFTSFVLLLSIDSGGWNWYDWLFAPLLDLGDSGNAEALGQSMLFLDMVFIVANMLALWLLQLHGRMLSWATLLLLPAQVVLFVSFYILSLDRLPWETQLRIALLLLLVFLLSRLALEGWELLRLAKQDRRAVTRIFVGLHLLASLPFGCCALILHPYQVADLSREPVPPILSFLVPDDVFLSLCWFASFLLLVLVSLAFWVLRLRGRSPSWATVLLAPAQLIVYLVLGCFSATPMEESIHWGFLIALGLTTLCNAGLDIWDLVRLRKQPPKQPAPSREPNPPVS